MRGSAPGVKKKRERKTTASLSLFHQPCLLFPPSSPTPSTSSPFFLPGTHKYLSFAIAINGDNSKYFSDVLRASRPRLRICGASFRGTRKRDNYLIIVRLVASKHLLFETTRPIALSRPVISEIFQTRCIVKRRQCQLSRYIPGFFKVDITLVKIH